MAKFYYTIGEVCNLLELKAHVLRYWEKEFPQLNPRKVTGRNRRYNQDDINLIKKIKYMLHTQRFTIEGVRQKLKEMNKDNDQMELIFHDERSARKKRIVQELQAVKKLLEIRS